VLARDHIHARVTTTRCAPTHQAHAIPIRHRLRRCHCTVPSLWPESPLSRAASTRQPRQARTRAYVGYAATRPRYMPLPIFRSHPVERQPSLASGKTSWLRRGEVAGHIPAMQWAAESLTGGCAHSTRRDDTRVSERDRGVIKPVLRKEMMKARSITRHPRAFEIGGPKATAASPAQYRQPTAVRGRTAAGFSARSVE